jgi:4-carboxymuconolactone decarboxylase
MKTVSFLTFLFAAVWSHQAVAQDSPIFPCGKKSPNVHHMGEVWLNELSAPDSNFQYNISFAVFAPNARLDWHAHPGGQILLITDGTGYYQEKGKPKQEVRKGDVVKCLPGVEHWHGATPESGVSYLATTPTQKGRTVWLQKVTDEQYYDANPTVSSNTDAAQETIQLSKTKWRWMAERKLDSLNLLFNEKAVFVHMGGNMTKEQELNVIKSGTIQYKHADIQETSVQFIENTAILLSKIRLTAIVGGNEVINPFVVTEVYVRQNGQWTLGSLSFTKLL